MNVTKTVSNVVIHNEFRSLISIKNLVDNKYYQEIFDDIIENVNMIELDFKDIDLNIEVYDDTKINLYFKRRDTYKYCIVIITDYTIRCLSEIEDYSIVLGPDDSKEISNLIIDFLK